MPPDATVEPDEPGHDPPPDDGPSIGADRSTDPAGDHHHHHLDHLADAAERAADAADHVIDPTARFRWKVGDSVRVVVAVVALAAGWIAAVDGVSDAEAAVFRTVNGVPDWLYPLLWAPMQLGNVSVAVGLAIVIGIVVAKPRLGFLAAGAALVAWLLAKAVKEQVRRGRPEPEGLATTLRGRPEGGFGFISGHTTVAFAVAAVAAPHLRRPWNWVVLALAVVVGVARIYVGAHLPLDVVGGAACGLLVGEVVRVAEVLTRRRVTPR